MEDRVKITVIRAFDVETGQWLTRVQRLVDENLIRGIELNDEMIEPPGFKVEL